VHSCSNPGDKFAKLPETIKGRLAARYHSIAAVRQFTFIAHLVADARVVVPHREPGLPMLHDANSVLCYHLLDVGSLAARTGAPQEAPVFTWQPHKQ
jgi:hypothetical protein